MVATGLHDLYKTKKDVSIHGAPVRRQVRLVKLLPHSLCEGLAEPAEEGPEQSGPDHEIRNCPSWGFIPQDG